MKKIIIAFMLLGVLSCKTELIDKIDVFALETGAYMRTVAPWPLNIANGIVYSKAALGDGNVKMTIEAVDPKQGTLFTSYDLTVRFVDNSTANGNMSKPYTALESLPASSFTKDATTGYPRREMTLPASTILTKLGLTAADVSAGDYFEVHAVMQLSDGRSFTDVNSGGEIKGGAYYKSPFFYRITVNP
ncbi:hypothetical protein [Dyadobacter sp. CY312]|uniref:hypothetical protein n=1 Tax=Dyadobacter sp. CY312 TaxID=2907303 RepID=UPI001F43001E|nr:hypothetical protein [Dyadobacter sp. CY312]MCE7041890.1 hypothetical protein [Dyadobacter sp. CY312]